MPTAAPKLAPLPEKSRNPPRGGPGRLWVRYCGRLLNPLLVFGGLWLAVRLRGVRFDQQYQALGIIACLICVLVFNGLGLNRSRWRSGNLFDLGSLFVAWGATFVVLLSLGYLTKSTAAFSRMALTTWLVITPVLLSLLHLALWSYFDWLRASGRDVRTAIIAPLPPVGQRLVSEFKSNPSLGVKILGYFGDAPRAGTGDTARLGALAELPDFLEEVPVDSMYLVLDQTVAQQLSALMDRLRGCGLSVFLVPDLLEFGLLDAQPQSLNGIPVIEVGNPSMDHVGGLAKRAMDILVALAGLVILSPLMAGAALAIKIDSQGPVLFRQRRYGLNGEEITVLKFRSMTTLDNQRDAMSQAVRHDPRVTRIGRWLRRTSLDELPQLFNVLTGTMSLVGPRPHAVAHNEFYRDKIHGYTLRHKVRPGMTGWAQVNGLRGETDTLEKMQRRLDYDLEYIRRWSLALDAWILLRTLPALLSNRDVY